MFKKVKRLFREGDKSELLPLRFDEPSTSTARPKAIPKLRSYGSFNTFWRNLRSSLSFQPTGYQGLNRVESMGLLGHRTILNYIEAEDLGGLKNFLDSRTIQVDDRDDNGTTPLMIASSKGLTLFVKELMSHGADVNAQDFDNWTALLCATKAGHIEIVELLVENGADIEHREMGNWTAISWACYKGHTNIVTFLLEHNADIHVNGNYHLSPLIWACGRGYTEIVQLLIQRGAKVNVGDKYGTTALVWACRKGNAEIVDMLLKAGANVDTAGMYSWTPLLVAAAGGHQEVIALLLERKPNVNSLDKDGSTALSIACKEGFQEIASALIAAGAYLNSQDRNGDTPLINAVKGGHRGICEALLKRHVDIDLQGKDKKTALYMAAEKGHAAIVKILLAANPDVELPNKDGETPLNRAVRNRNVEIVQMLLDKRAKVGALDRRGDTCLHIAMRARSKGIVEALLRNPKNSQLLYRANKAGETPYQLDALHQKTILGQVFGARKLNTNEDSEGMLGYELYSSALADVLSEPTLTTPIAVGLFAKWGSGKSFLLTKLREEMSSFWPNESPVKAYWLFVLISIHLAVLLGIIVGLSLNSAIWGTVSGVSFTVLLYAISLVLRIINRRYSFDWSFSLHHSLLKKIGKFRLILQVAFCHPPGPNHSQANLQTMPVRFHFAETNSAAPSGEYAIGFMLASLFIAIENYYGSIPTRLYRAFRPKPLKPSSSWRFRKMCCLPLFLLFEIFIFVAIASISLLILLLTGAEPESKKSLEVSVYILGGILVAGAFVNLNAWAKAFNTIFFSQGRYLKQIMKSNEGLTALGSEVLMLSDMVKCLDSFTGQQSRLVGVIDTLDSCDTERTLSVLNAVQTLLLTPNRPFVLLIAVDPHVVAKAAEANSKRLFTEGGIGGHDFLRNLVHLPVYLQNSGLRKVQRAQNTAMQHKRIFPEHQFDTEVITGGLGYSASCRRLSNASEIMSSTEKLRAPPPSRGGSKKLKLSESIASSIGSNMHKLGGGGQYEFSKVMLTDDYFSDVNPRSMRRLMNVIYITVRLLKAFQIDFSWYRLSSWVNLTEQWPLRASMIVLEHDRAGDNLEESASLQSLYEKVRPKLPCLREAAPLLDLDRDERKLDAFLQLHKTDLQVSDLRIFLPFTINLDPYLRKVLKEDQQAIEDDGIIIPMKTNLPNVPINIPFSRNQNFFNTNQQNPQAFNRALPMFPNNLANAPLAMMNYFSQNTSGLGGNMEQDNSFINHQQAPQKQPIPIDLDLSQTKLSKLDCEDFINLLSQVNELKGAIEKLAPILRENAITGRVLLYCELNELKSILQLNFGNWEIFKLLVQSLRDIETTAKSIPTVKTDNRDINDGASNSQQPPPMIRKQKSVIEKQVTLEEQMICGALQTLNEDAFEDVAVSERPSPTGVLSASRSNSPATQRKSNTILRHQNSVKNDRGIKKVSLEVVNEKPSQKMLGRLSQSTLSKPIFHMGASFEDKSDDESLFDSNGTTFNSNNNVSNGNGKSMKDENIPLVTRK